jgi:LacI family transcriptional regulator
MNAALVSGISIPKQVKVIGCGNLHYDDSLRISLSSVDQKSAKIGERAADIILKELERQRQDEVSEPLSNKEFTRVVLHPQLVIRNSTRA